MNTESKVLELRSQGKTYKEIGEILGLSKGAAYYYCKVGVKERYSKKQKLRRKNKVLKVIYKKLWKFQSFGKQREIIYNKIFNFHKESKNGNMGKTTFTVDDIVNKFGETTKCYLTGKPINIFETNTYQFDHIIPRSRGGDNTIENLGICCSEVNKSKNDMLVSEYLELCKIVLENSGYIITKNQ